MNLNRREFISFGTSALCVGGFSLAADAMRDPLAPLNLKKIEINVGATKPFTAIQLSDTHIVRADKRDDNRKRMLVGARNFAPWGEYYLDQAVRKAKEDGSLLLHTGDLIDFVSEANFDQAEGRFAGNDWFVAAGNHEYSQYVGDAKEDEAYKMKSFKRVQRSFPNDLRFASRVVNGVNFIAIDDVYYYFRKEEIELFKKEVEKGLPIVMMCHVPLYTPELCKYVLSENNHKAGYVTGAPVEITDTYLGDLKAPPGQEWRRRKVQQAADKTTLDFIAYLKEQKLLKAILCGHLHRFFDEQFSPTARQYVCSATYKGEAYSIKFV